MKSQSNRTLRHLLGQLSLFALLLLCLTLVPSRTSCAAGSYMKTMKGLKWDLKKGKKLKGKLRVAGVGLKDYTIMLTKYKVTGPDRYGMKTLTYTVKFTPSWKPTKAQVHKIANSDSVYYDDIWEASVYDLQPDYFTGYDLEYWKKSPVQITLGKWKEADKKYYYDNDGCYYYTNSLQQTTKVRFPASYKGLCIVLGTSHVLTQTAADQSYLDGKKPFGKTSFYKKSIGSFHAMRVK